MKVAGAAVLSYGPVYERQERAAEPPQETLPRSMGLGIATAVVVSNVIGVGIFTASGFLARDLPDPRLLLLIWLGGGVMALSGALSYAELGARLPRAGGEYVYLREAFGPLVGFLNGWGSLFAGFSAPIAAAAVGFTQYASSLFPVLSLERGLGAVRPGHLVAALLIVALSAIHYRKVRIGGRFHIALTSVTVALIVGLIAAGFLVGRGDSAGFAGTVRTREWPSLALPLGSGMILVMFCYSGWNAAAYIAGEIRDPARNLPRSLLLGTLAVTILYLALNALYLYAIPIGAMRGVVQVAELAARNLFGPAVAPFLSLIIMLAILGSISAMIIAGPRLYFAMAQDSALPAGLGRVHPRFRTPANAILLQAVWSVLLVFTGQFENLLRFSGAVLISFSALAVLSLFVLRRRDRQAPAYRAWGYPWTTLLFMAGSVAMLVSSLLRQPMPSLYGLLVVASGVPFFYYWRHKQRD